MASGAQLITAAEHFAREVHRNQRRKFYDAPYAVHLERCAKRAARLGLPDYAVAGMWCHDTMEDQGVTFDQLSEVTDDSVARLVLNLTNPSSRHRDWPRELKKQVDREHIGQQSQLVRMMKLIDRLDNLQDMIRHHEAAPLAIRKRYVAETRELMVLLGEKQEVLGHGMGGGARVTGGYVGGTNPPLEREMARTLAMLSQINDLDQKRPPEITQKLPQETPA